MAVEQPNSQIELSILMPCLNEARTLPGCIQKARAFLNRSKVVGEIVVADNGSNDGSVEAAAAHGARVVHVSVRGYGAALRTGIEMARGRYVIMGDADDSYDFERLEGFLDKLREGHQLVMGNRFKGGIERGAMPWHHRYVGNPVLSSLARLFFPSPVGDFHCGLRGFDRQAILALNLSAPGMEYASEMVVKAKLAKLHVTEIPTTLRKDGRDRPPHLRSFRDGWRHLRFLLLHSPRWLFIYPGFALIAAGVLAQALIYPEFLPIGPLNLDIHSMLFGSAALVLGSQLLCFGLLCRYLGWQQGVLPVLPKEVAWAASLSLETVLVFGGVLFLIGLCWASAVTLHWVNSGFASLDPRQSMRGAIPAVSLMLVGGQVVATSLILAAVRMWELSRPSGATHKETMSRPVTSDQSFQR